MRKLVITDKHSINIESTTGMDVTLYTYNTPGRFWLTCKNKIPSEEFRYWFFSNEVRTTFLAIVLNKIIIPTESDTKEKNSAVGA